MFGLRDALFRSVSLIGSSFTIAAISLLPGFGVKGLLIATSIQLILSSILELPTSIAADRFGRSFILRISLALKLLVSLALGSAIYFASKGQTQYVWYSFFFEAFIDAISNTLLSGSYQVSYLTLYDSIESDINLQKPPLFLKSFEYGIKFRILFPIGFVLFIVTLFQFYEASNSNLYNCAYLILALIIITRLLLLGLVNYDFIHLESNFDRAKNGIRNGLSEVFKTIQRQKVLFLNYSLTSLLNFISIFYLTGQAIKALQNIGLSSESTWMAAIGTSILIYLLRTIVSIRLLPKLSKELLGTLMPTFGYLVFLGGSTLCGIELFIESALSKYLIFIFLTSTLYIVGDSLSKAIESSLKELVKTDYKATWLSLGNTLAYLIFGFLSLIISQTLFSYANLFVGGLLAVCGIYILVSQLLILPDDNHFSFIQVLRSQLIKVLLIVVVSIIGIDIGSYILTVRQKIADTKEKTSSTVLLGIKSSLIQGNIIEASNFLYSLKSGHFIKCFSLNALGTVIDDCELNHIKSTDPADSDIIEIKYDNNSYGSTHLYFDLNPIKKDLYVRILMDVILSFFLYSFLYYIFQMISKALTTEVNHLHNTLEAANSDDSVDKFKIKEFKEIHTHLLQTIKLQETIQFQSAMANVASQVSHDIRSPLTALNMILSQTNAFPEQSRILVRQAVNRITDIANSLLYQNKKQTQTSEDNNRLEFNMLSSLVDSLVSEKRIALRDKTNIHIEARLDKSYGLFSKINSIEMKRLVSNSINNSVEALGINIGLIEVILNSLNDQVILTIKDNGKGIPPEVLQKLGAKGITHGKEGTESGSGLGVYHAKQTIESFGGTYEIQSKVGAGTSVIITLKKEEPPTWFVQKLSFNEGQFVVATDDDNSILEIWRQRFENLNLNLITCASGTCLKTWVEKNSEIAKFALYLVDYELLGQNQNGLDLIEELGLNVRAILVSSRYEEPKIKERCIKLGVKMIPKGMASLVPVEIEKPKPILDGVLIDDDIELSHMIWKMMAKEKNKNVLCFSDEESFLIEATDIANDTPIFIDVNLKNGVRGLEVAYKLNQMGFNNLNLATGYEASGVEHPDFIKNVTGKEFPL